jgi:DNA-binding transcriptional MerR regulator
MPTIDIQQLSKLYYSIGELSELLGVNASLLRFWEKEFEFIISKKNAKGNRLYSVKEIEKINRIYILLKIEGYTIEGARKMLKLKLIDKSQAENNMKNDYSDIITRLQNIKMRLLLLK